MKTCEWTERVALAVDEPDRAVEAHVAECGECRALLADLRSDSELLARAPEIPEWAVLAVRERVSERVRPSRPWWWQAAAAAILASFGVGWWMTRLPEVERLEIAVSTPAAPGLAPPKPPAERPHRRVPRTVPRPEPNRKPNDVELALALREMLEPEVRPTVSAPGQIVMSIQTEDPEVVIVLVSESKGAAE